MQLLKHFASLTLHPKNAKELKGLILQLALQGKLTANWREENSNIETSEIILKHINKVKSKLINEKKIKKEKPIPLVKNNEIPFKLPNKWSWCRLNDLCVIGSSSRVHQKDWQTEGVPFYRAREIVKLSKNGIVDNDLFITEELYNKFNENGSVPEANDIMITGVGTIGIPYTVKKEDKFYFKDASVLIFKNLFNLDTNYLTLFFSSQYWINEIHKDSMGTTVHTLTIARAKLIPAIFPPLEEQKEIVRVVEILFKEVEQLEQLTVERIALKNDYVTSALQQLTTQNSQIEWQSLKPHFKDFFTEKSTIKKLRETVLQLAVQGKLTADWRTKNTEVEHANELLKRIQKEKAQLIKDKKIKKESPLPAITKEEIPYELPDGWEFVKLGNFLKVITDGSHFSPATGDIGTPYITVRDIDWKGNIDLINCKKINQKSYLELVRSGCKPEINDVLFSKDGTVGKTFVVDIEDDFVVLSSLAILKPLANSIDSYFLEILLQSPSILDQAIAKKSGSALRRIVLAKIKQLIVPIPPLEEQKAIVEKVNALMGLCDVLEQEVEESKAYSEQLMQSVLREVFEGDNSLIV